MDTAAQTGFWELAAIMVVIASWILYRYVAPKGWREWSWAGLVQAFVIALYAEMYGFPLTIYVLTGFLGIDIPQLHGSGHLVATLLGAGVFGQTVEMVVGYGFLFLGVSLLVGSWREVYLASRAGRLATEGLYGSSATRSTSGSSSRSSASWSTGRRSRRSSSTR